MDWNSLRGSCIKEHHTEKSYDVINKQITYIINKKLEKHFKKYPIKDNTYMQWKII